MKKTPEDHPWRGHVIRVQSTTASTKDLTLNEYVLFHSIVHHLCNNNHKYTMPRELYIHSHHFPISILRWERKNPEIILTTPISRSVVNNMSTDNFSLNQIAIACNSVYYLHHHQLKRFLSERLPVGPTDRYLFLSR